MEKNNQLVRNFVEDILTEMVAAPVDRYMAEAEGFKQYLGEFFLWYLDSHTTVDHIVASRHCTSS